MRSTLSPFWREKQLITIRPHHWLLGYMTLSLLGKLGHFWSGVWGRGTAEFMAFIWVSNEIMQRKINLIYTRGHPALVTSALYVAFQCSINHAILKNVMYYNGLTVCFALFANNTIYPTRFNWFFFPVNIQIKNSLR